MGKPKQEPELRIMELYDNLSEDGKRIVNAMIRSGIRPAMKPKQARQKKTLTELVTAKPEGTSPIQSPKAAGASGD